MRQIYSKDRKTRMNQWFPGTAAFACLLLGGLVEVSAQPASGASGPLKYTIALDKTAYALGDTIVVQATLTNVGKQPVTVHPPSLHTDRHLLDNKHDLTAKVLETVRLRAPSADDLVRLAPGQTVRFTHHYQVETVAALGKRGKHMLVGKYNTLGLKLDGAWKGMVNTQPLAFTLR